MSYITDNNLRSIGGALEKNTQLISDIDPDQSCGDPGKSCKGGSD